MLPPAAALGESILVGLRLVEGVDLAALSREYGLAAETVFGAAIEAHVSEGLAELRDRRLRLTPRGLRFANRVQVDFTLPSPPSGA